MISQKEYERNCKYSKMLKELQGKCNHPIRKRFWYYNDDNRVVIVCSRCGYSKILGDKND